MVGAEQFVYTDYATMKYLINKLDLKPKLEKENPKLYYEWNEKEWGTSEHLRQPIFVFFEWLISTLKCDKDIWSLKFVNSLWKFHKFKMKFEEKYTIIKGINVSDQIFSK